MAKPISHCSVDTCSSRAYGQGLCSKHYQRMKRHGTTDKLVHTLKPIKAICSLCTKPATAKGYCSNHYAQIVFKAVDRPRCSVDTCDKPVNSHGLCISHSRYMRKYGQLTPPSGPTPEEIFWTKVNKNSGKFFNGVECWDWLGGVANGYGHCTIAKGTSGIAHRFAYAILIKKLPKNIHLHHQCQNKLCVNPAHLQERTAEDHVIDTMIETLIKLGYTVTPPE